MRSASAVVHHRVQRAQAIRERRHSRSMPIWPLAPGGRPDQPTAPLPASSTLTGTVVVHAATSRARAVPATRRMRASSRSGDVGPAIRLTDRGLAVIMAGFIVAVVLGLVVVGVQYLAIGTAGLPGLA